MESNFQKLISLFIIQYSMIEAAHLTRQETKELCQQEVQRYIHVLLCTNLKPYLFFFFFIIILILWCFQLYVERKVLLWLFNYDVFKYILCVFQTWKWSTITEGENKGKRRMWRLNFWIATVGKKTSFVVVSFCF